MDIHWIRKPVLLGLGLSATLAVAVAGCGGEGSNKDEGVLVSRAGCERELEGERPARRRRRGAPETRQEHQHGTDLIRHPSRRRGGELSRERSSLAALRRNPRSWSRRARPRRTRSTAPRTHPSCPSNSSWTQATKGVKNAFIYLLRPTAINPEAKKAAESAKLEFDQKGCIYNPHALAVMVGDTVKVKTSDPVNHNVNFQLKTLTENKVLAPGNTMDVTPTSPERNPGLVSCSIHPWMQAYWLVLDHPYFAITDEKGNFEIKNVPGRHPESGRVA